ncbi:MAG: hypothetical protein ACFFDI_33265 [Promethearchaeota archaeon]
MVKKTNILQSQDPQLNATFLIVLSSPFLIEDYELRKDGLYCYFTKPICHCRNIIKIFLAALFEITNRQFYLEIVNEREAILKIYGIESLKFSHDILFQPTISSQGGK